MTSRRRARETLAASNTSSASTVLKLSSMSSIGTATTPRRRATNASTLFAARPGSPSGSSGSPTTIRSAPWPLTTAAIASRSRWPPRRGMVCSGCAVSPSPSVTATPMRRAPRSIAITLPGTAVVYTVAMADQPKDPAGDPAAPPGAPQIQIDVDETTAQGSYSNLVLINHNENEFVLDFAYIQPSAPRARVRARIISSPRHTKRLLRALEHNVRRYEERFGRIEEPEPMSIPTMPSGGLIS